MKLCKEDRPVNTFQIRRRDFRYLLAKWPNYLILTLQSKLEQGICLSIFSLQALVADECKLFLLQILKFVRSKLAAFHHNRSPMTVSIGTYTIHKETIDGCLICLLFQVKGKQTKNSMALLIGENTNGSRFLLNNIVPLLFRTS